MTGSIREKLLKKARNYLDNVTPEELEMALIKCGLYTIKPAPIPIYDYEFKESEHIKISIIDTSESGYEFNIQLKRDINVYKCPTSMMLLS